MATASSKSTSSTQLPYDFTEDRDIEKGVADGLDGNSRRYSPDKNLEQASREGGTNRISGSHGDGEKEKQDNALASAPTHDPAYEVSFDGLSDPINPRGRYTKWQKWLFVLLCSSTSLCVTCASSLYTMTYEQLEDEFGCSEIVATLGLSLFVAGLGLGPMLLAPLSEVSCKGNAKAAPWLIGDQFYGRKPIYIISLLQFVIWLIPCALAQNTATMLVARFINGFAGAAFLSGKL